MIDEVTLARIMKGVRDQVRAGLDQAEEFHRELDGASPFIPRVVDGKQLSTEERFALWRAAVEKDRL